MSIHDVIRMLFNFQWAKCYFVILLLGMTDILTIRHHDAGDDPLAQVYVLLFALADGLILFVAMSFVRES